jgi:hypothetical protein
MKKVNWTVVVIVAIVALFVLQVAGYLLGGSRFGGWGMMGPGMMSGWGFSPFGWISMAFMWLIPIGFLVLTVLGIAWLVRTIGGGTIPPAASTYTCPNCGRDAQTDWKNCPYCGAMLAK